MSSFVLLFLLEITQVYAAYNAKEAMDNGLITLSGSSSSGYSESKIIVTNKKNYSVDIDFSTIWLVQNNDTQRIGLVYEKSTRGYVLKLKAGKTYTLYFISRCLDKNRHTPVTGTSFTKISTISSQFSQIINALRNNYSQSAVWDITDNSSLSKSWKMADPRYVAPAVISSNDYIDLSGNVSWNTSGNTIVIKAGMLQNNSQTATTGSLRLRVWATRSPYTGGGISGYVMGAYQLKDQLQPGYYYSDISSGSVPYTRPPRGTYYTTITVEEYDNGWYEQDYINFNGTTTF
jgi:hypothetical protein